MRGKKKEKKIVEKKEKVQYDMKEMKSMKNEFEVYTYYNTTMIITTRFILEVED